MVTILLTIPMTVAFGQSKSDIIRNIEQKVQFVKQATGYKRVTLINEEFIDTGFIKQPGKGYGQLTGFFRNDSIYKICEQIGVRVSHDSFTTDYYFFDGKLIFVYEKYGKEEEKGFVENSFMESDGTIGYRTPSLPFEGRYYFDNDKLIFTETKGEIETMLLPNEKFYDSQKKEGQLLLATQNYISLLSAKLSGSTFGQNTGNSIQTKVISVKSIKDLERLPLNFCDTFSVEITGLYSILKTLPSLQEDSTIVKTLLLKNGFSQVDWGTGNWQKGPRFIYLKFMKGDCTCKTYKKYYYNQSQKDESFDLRISERIICNSDKFMDE